MHSDEVTVSDTFNPEPKTEPFQSSRIPWAFFVFIFIFIFIFIIWNDDYVTGCIFALESWELKLLNKSNLGDVSFGIYANIHSFLSIFVKTVESGRAKV